MRQQKTARNTQPDQEMIEKTTIHCLLKPLISLKFYQFHGQMNKVDVFLAFSIFMQLMEFIIFL